ncbi:protein NLRC3-like [Engraulis encrasicolus]|uniref:protein NLRC3-like n=1 Tax=Engraulis encrasicolus TaxID=184585 RepID=UPI002FCF0E67
MDEPDIRETDPPPEESVQLCVHEESMDEPEIRGMDPPPEERLTPEEAELRSFLKEKCQHLVEGVPHQGDDTLLQDIYTDLYITEGASREVNEEHEVREIDRASCREGTHGRLIKCSDIFKPLHPQRGLLKHKPIRVVLTKGVAGIGKTVSVQKFILDWTEGETNQDIHFIFPLPFRELNLMKNTKLSLVELVQCFFTQMKDLKVLSSSESKTLFIFDGLDECRLPLDFCSSPRCCEVTEPASVNVLLTSLINGNLLPSALVWITTRPAAAGQIPAECVDQVTEIRGFNNPQKDEYFKKRISDENLAMRVIRHLKSSRSLYIMCHIPVFAWILVIVVEKTSERGEMPRTLTQMYTRFLNIQTCIKKEKYTERRETDEEMVLKLGKLAFQQLEKGNLIFYEEDLRESGIDVTEASLYSGVCTQIFRVEAGLCHGRVFSFVHLTIQEFLAALYVFLCFCNSARNEPHQYQPSQLSALFRAATLEDLHKNAVDLALQSENGHLDLFLRFLVGLSLESNQKLLTHLLPHTNSQPQSFGQTVQYVKYKIRHERKSDRKINLFYCLNELNQHAVVEHTGRSPVELSVEMLLPGQWETREFEFELSEEQLDGFDLQKYIKTPEEDLTDLLSPDDVLKKLVPAVSSALLKNCSLTERSCAAIAAAARSTSCSLKTLVLSTNSIHDTGVQHLSELLLKNPQCQLETLVLRYCSLTEKSCAAIAAAARSTSCSLKSLLVSGNSILDEGVQHLSDLFKNPQCKLETLELDYCSLTEKSCAAIAAAARSTSCSLKTLDLSDNKIHDTGVQHLSELLKNPQCKLETLKLGGNYLTEKSCVALAAAARSTCCSLRTLDVRDNRFHDTAIQHLSELLKNPQCKLEIVVVGYHGSRCTLRRENNGSSSSSLLRPAAAASGSSSHSSDAAELHLTHNTQQHPGAQLLSTHTPTEDDPGDDTQSGCGCCADFLDTSHWILVEPEVSTEKSISTYSLSSAAGSYECSESSLRWSCVGPVTLQYRFMDWYIFTEELARMQCSPAGPLMDIKLMSGELEEIHLPHFLCLGGSQLVLKDAVKVLHHQDGEVYLETCELTRHHARLLQPSLSPRGLLYSITSWLLGRVHANVLVYQSSISHLEFRCYLLPEDPNLKEKVKEEEKEFGGVRQACPHPKSSLRINECYSLCGEPSTIYPDELELMYRETPNFFQVKLPDPAPASLHLQLFSSASRGQQAVWRAEFQTGTQDRQTWSSGLTEEITMDTHTAVDQAMGFQDVQRPEYTTRVPQVSRSTT